MYSATLADHCFSVLIALQCHCHVVISFNAIYYLSIHTIALWIIQNPTRNALEELLTLGSCLFTLFVSFAL